MIARLSGWNRTRREMMSRWNFRRSWWTGKLVLQRFMIWRDDGREYGEWRDADTSDLRDYFDDLGRPL